MEGEKKRVYGPTFPPQTSNESTKEEAPKADPPKRVFGPARPPPLEAEGKVVHGPARPPNTETTKRSRSRSPPASSAGRDSWMTEYDQKGEMKMDPLNIKARTFVQKQTSPALPPKDIQVVQEEREIEEKVAEYNVAFRSKTLQEEYEEEHMEKKLSAAKTEREERIFDWERDMNASVRRMSGKSAQDLLNRSTLNDRFGSSSSSKKYL